MCIVIFLEYKITEERATSYTFFALQQYGTWSASSICRKIEILTLLKPYHQCYIVCSVCDSTLLYGIWSSTLSLNLVFPKSAVSRPSLIDLGKQSVLFHLDYHNITIDWWLMNHRNLFLTDLKLEIGTQGMEDFISRGDLIPGALIIVFYFFQFSFSPLPSHPLFHLFLLSYDKVFSIRT